MEIYRSSPRAGTTVYLLTHCVAVALLFSSTVVAETDHLSAEPNVRLASDWWPRLINVYTPVGWKNHLFRFNVFYNGTVMADPVPEHASPALQRWRGRGVVGVLPPAVATDRGVPTQAVWNIGWNYRGLTSAVALLRRIGHPRATALAREAEQYKATFVRALRERTLRMPTWTDNDGSTHQSKDRYRFLEGMYSMLTGAHSRQTYIACETRGGITGLAGHIGIYAVRLSVIDDLVEPRALHLLRLVPLAWLRSDQPARFENVPTIFGPVDLGFQLTGGKQRLDVAFHARFHHPPEKVLLHVPPLPQVNEVVVNGRTIAAHADEVLAIEDLSIKSDASGSQDSR